MIDDHLFNIHLKRSRYNTIKQKPCFMKEKNASSFQGAVAIITYLATLIQFDAVTYSMSKKEQLASKLSNNSSD